MKNIRALAILLLDDEHGISDAAMEALVVALDGSHQDILDVVHCEQGRNFIHEDAAEILRERTPANA